MAGNACVICQEDAAKRCGGCHQVYYCNKDHQKLDWLRHKNICKPFKVCEDKKVGRHLVATRDIKAGEVVLRETPLLQGPSQVTGPVCLGCLQHISQYNSEPCSSCGWPLCRKPTCKQAKQHQPECHWAQEKRKCPVKISQFVSPHPSYQCITTLRLCYLKLHSPSLWSRLAGLQAHTRERRDTIKYAEDTYSIAQFLRRFYKLQEEFTDDELMEMLGIIQVNGHEVPVTQPAHVAVYDNASMLEHSCVPNCSKSFTPEGGLLIRAVTAIPQNTHLSICYTDGLWGTANRQSHLAQTKYFACRCARCVDPTEFGSCFSALICDQSDCKGTVLPKDLCSLEDDTLWTCGRCGHSRTCSEVEDLLQQAGEELATLSAKELSASLTFLDQWRGKLHRHHYYLTEVRVAVAQRLGQEDSKGVQGLSDQQLALKTDLCRQLLQLVPVVAPGECRLLGVLHFELHAALAEKASRGLPSDLIETLMEARGCLEKTIYWLQYEPDVVPEGKLLLQARMNKVEVEKTLEGLHKWASSIPSM